MSQTKQTYTQALKRLEAIAETLEKGELPLEDAMKLYEESVKLADFCYKQLNEYKAKIEILSKGDADD